MDANADEARPQAGTVGAAACPLCVDLDGTLVRTDTLHEAYLRLVRRRPADAARAPLWLLRGRSHLKRQVATRAGLDAATLPYNRELVEFLREQKAAGRSLVLVTGADAAVALAVAEHLGLFDAVLAGDGVRPMTGRGKARVLLERFGERGFDYIGDAGVDLHVWRHARRAVVVGGPGLARRVEAIGALERTFPRPAPSPRTLVKAFRVHQWSKNALILLPLILAHRLGDLPKLLAASVAFLCFCGCASSAYILNDLLDLEGDRAHRTKQRRPFASGALPLAWGPPLVVGLLAASLAAALAWLPPAFSALLAFYYALTCLYSFVIKRRLLVDVMTLAGLYTLRILAGGAAASVEVSDWCLAFSMFLFVSLAFAKRYVELRAAAQGQQLELKGRGYRVGDLPLLEAVGPASGYMAVLVLALYIQGEQVQTLYRHPRVLWLVCPLLLYWITRVWFFARRDALPDDPIVFALKDGVSLAAGVVAAAILAAATYL
jgi:4-hydroxybenzoate polyprenyltransferase